MGSLKSSTNIILLVLVVQIIHHATGRLPPKVKAPVVESTQTKSNSNNTHKEKGNCCNSLYDPLKLIIALRKCVLAYGNYSLNETTVNSTRASDDPKLNFTHNQADGNESESNTLNFHGTPTIPLSLIFQPNITNVLPCFGTCILMQLGYIYNNGTANHSLIAEQLKKVNSGITGEQSEKIINGCYSKSSEYNGTRLITSNDNSKDKIFHFAQWDPTKCELVSKFGICVAKGASELCRSKSHN